MVRDPSRCSPMQRKYQLENSCASYSTAATKAAASSSARVAVLAPGSFADTCNTEISEVLHIRVRFDFETRYIYVKSNSAQPHTTLQFVLSIKNQ